MVSNQVYEVDEQVQNNASVPCDVEITACFYSPEDGSLLGTGTGTFYAGAYQTVDFTMWPISVNEPPGVDYNYDGHWTIEITDVSFY